MPQPPPLWVACLIATTRVAQDRRRRAMTNPLSKKKGNNPIVITEEGRSVIEDLLAEGFDDRTIAKAVGITVRTLTNCKKRDKRVAESFKDGHARLADTITSLLLAAGKKGNVIALIFLAKCRLGWIDQPKPDPPAPSILIQLPDSRTPEEHMRLLEFNPGEQIGETVQKTDIFGEIPAPKAKAVIR